MKNGMMPEYTRGWDNPALQAAKDKDAQIIIDGHMQNGGPMSNESRARFDQLGGPQERANFINRMNAGHAAIRNGGGGTRCRSCGAT